MDLINDKSQGSVATCLRCGGLFTNHFTTDLLLSLLVKQFLKYVNIWQSYRQEITNWPLNICKNILLQYLFFCITADAYCRTVGILLWPLCVSFSQWTKYCWNDCKEFLTTVLSGWVLHNSLLYRLRRWVWQFFEDCYFTK